MAQGNLAACLAVTLPHEGGWSDHPRDPGGATMKGITLATYRKYRPGATKTQLRNISDAEVRRIYDDGYWRPIKGDSLPAGVDLGTFDYGVNSGPSRAAKDLQRALGVKADGVIGPETLKAAILADKVQTIQRLCAKRLSFLQGLKIWATFKRGWSRRVADVEAKAVAMWLSSAGIVDVKRELEAEAGKARGKAEAQTVGAGGAGAAGSGAVVGGGDLNWIVIGGLVALALVAFVLLVERADRNRDRAKAYLKAAAEA